MDILSLAILIFIIMESANVAILYFRPGSRIGNGVGVYSMLSTTAKGKNRNCSLPIWSTGWQA